MPNSSHLGSSIKACRSDADCDASNAEVCLNSRQCVHLGWVGFSDRVLFVRQRRGWVSVPIVRYGWPNSRLETVVGARLARPMRGFRVPFSSDYSGNLSSIRLGSSKFWAQAQQGIRLLHIEVEPESVGQFEIELVPRKNAFIKGIRRCRIVILGQKESERGSVGFTHIEHRVEESDGNITLEVARTGGKQGPITVEYSLKRHRVEHPASFGRDFRPFGVWDRIVHHECDYLRPVGDLGPRGDNLTQSTRLFDRSEQWLQRQTSGLRSRNWLANGCCSESDSPFTFPSRRVGGLFQFRLTWDLNPELEEQVWQQHLPPQSVNKSSLHGLTLDVSRFYASDRTVQNVHRPAYSRHFGGLFRCDGSEQCKYEGSSSPEWSAFQLGLRHPRLSDANDPRYRRRGCLNGPIDDSGEIPAVDSASLWVKFTDQTGTLHWDHGDDDPKLITIEIIDDAVYEPTESFVVSLQPEWDELVRPQQGSAIVYIQGPNDVDAGVVGFEQSEVHTGEGTTLCIPLSRRCGSNENVYLSYQCQMGSAMDWDAGPMLKRDVDWVSPKRGQIRWQSGQSHTQCILVRILRDQMYERSEHFSCSVSRVWGDNPARYSPALGQSELRVWIDENDDQFGVLTPWLIAKEGSDSVVWVQRQGFRGRDVSVRYSVAECQSPSQCRSHSPRTFAEIGRDFAAISGELWFLANESFARKPVRIPILDDGLREDTEAFLFVLEPGSVSEGSIVDPMQLPSDDTDPRLSRRNFSTDFHIFRDRSQIWIHGPNNLPRTTLEFVTRDHSGKVVPLDTSRPLIVAEPRLRNWTELTSTVGVRRSNERGNQFDYVSSVEVRCQEYTALDKLDFDCRNQGLFEWAAGDGREKWLHIRVFDDDHWESTESFSVELTAPFNADLPHLRRSLRIEIPANDEPQCQDASQRHLQQWSPWTECDVKRGTGTENRTRVSIFSDRVSFSLSCVNITESRPCQRDDSGLGPMLRIHQRELVLLEGHPARSQQRVTVSLGGMPLMSEVNMRSVNSAEHHGCVVSVRFHFDVSSELRLQPNQLCWTNLSWAEQKTVQLSVQDDSVANPRSVREHTVSVRSIRSVDPDYRKLGAAASRGDPRYTIRVLVIDDELCEPSEGCFRDSPDVMLRGSDDGLFEDSFELVQLSRAEVVLSLALFLAVVLCSLGLRLWLKVRQYRQSSSEKETELLFERESDYSK